VFSIRKRRRADMNFSVEKVVRGEEEEMRPMLHLWMIQPEVMGSEVPTMRAQFLQVTVKRSSVDNWVSC
jgi:hypothetical protein